MNMYRIMRLMLLTSVGFTEHVGSLVLTSAPMTATDGEFFTLICSSNTAGGQDRQWSRDGTFLLTTTQGSSSPSISNPEVFNMYLSGRVNVSCDTTQHNVTLRINPSVDNGSRWQCVDNRISQRSNTMTIYVTVHQRTRPTSVSTVSTTTTTTASSSSTVPPDVTIYQTTSTHPTPVSTVSTTTTTTASSSSTAPPGDTSMPITTPPVTTTQQCQACVTSPSGVYVAAGTVGGAVFGSVVTVVVVALWTHNKNKTKDAQTPNVYASTSAYEDVDHQYAMAPRQYVNSVEGTETPHYVITDSDTGDTAYYNTTR